MAYPSGTLYDGMSGFSGDSKAIQDMRRWIAGGMVNGVHDPNRAQQAQSAAASSGQAQSDAMFDKIKALTEGRANEIRNDPVQKQVMDYLQGIISGKDVPYTDTVLNSLQAQHGKGTASAEAAQMEALRGSLGAGGGSIYDPSYQAAGREMASERQGRNLDYGGQLNAMAGVENFNAKSGASGMLGSLRSNQNAQISGLGQALAGYQAQRFQETPSTTPTTLMPQYGGGGMGMAGAGQTQPKAPSTSMASAKTPQMSPMPQPTAPAPTPQASDQPQAQPTLQHPDMTSGWDTMSAVARKPQSPWTTQQPNDIASLLGGLMNNRYA